MWVQSQISAGLAAILSATISLFGVIVLRDESATPLKILVVVVGFAGVIVMMDL